MCHKMGTLACLTLALVLVLALALAVPGAGKHIMFWKRRGNRKLAESRPNARGAVGLIWYPTIGSNRPVLERAKDNAICAE